MPVIDTPAGTLEVTNAILSASEFRATQKISVSNSAPTKNFSVGDKFHVSTTDVDAVNITGNLVAQKLKIGNLLVSPTFDLAAVSNVGNTTSNTLQFANATTSFVASSNVEIGGNITLTSNAQVKVGSNVLAEYTGPHGREPTTPLLKKFPEIDFAEGKFDKNDTTNTYTQGGYTISANAQYYTGNYNPWEMYAPGGTGPLTGTHYWSSDSTQLYNAYWGGTLVGSPSAHYQTVVSSVTYNGVFTTIQLPHKIKLNSIDIQSHAAFYFPHSGIIAGSTDGSTWNLIHSFSELSTPEAPIIENIITNSAGNTNHYNYFRLIITKGGGNAYIGIRHLRWNGTEEPAPPGDLSLDTTLKSTFNSVRSNNYVMYFDGDGFIPGDNTSNNLVTGSNKSVIHHNATYDTTEKYWTLDGSTESNVTTGSLGLVGDTPHTVSTWINASNLDANATTQQLFSIGSGYSEEIVRVDDTQIAANTWHNVTYAYQGEGGSKVTYVDGRKVEEAQVEDTFGEYPPFAMTDYKTGGYCVSASSRYKGDTVYTYREWEVFDKSTASGNHWLSASSSYDTDGTPASGAPQQSESSNTWTGEYLQLELPYKIQLNHIEVRRETHANGLYRVPRSGAILGSNDGENWSFVHSWTDLAASSFSATVNTSLGGVSTTGCYKYFKFITTKVPSNSTVIRCVALSEIRYYGHKEGDLTRFPEPTRVLKYPHILTKNGTGDGYTSATSAPEYGKRGYVIKGSSSIASYPPYAAFNGETNIATGSVWVGGYNQYGTSHGNGTGGYGGSRNLKTDLGTGGSATSNGEWLYIEMPHKIKVTSTKIVSYDTSPSTGHPPENLIIYGTNDPSSSGGWNVVDNTYASSSSGVPNNATGKTWAVSTASSPVAYKYFAYVLVKVNNSGTVCHAIVSDWQLFGTQEDTGTPAIVGGPFAGKVANFRVYDQYLGDERIQEIYDAQKDEFGHKKSSMTFYKGRVGVGTTEPEGALTVLDEPHALTKFPARALSADYSYVEGDGCIKLSAAGGYGSSGSSNSNVYQAFDDKESTCWDSAPGINTRVSEDVDFGAWLKIQTPESISLKKAEIQSNAHWYQVGSEIAGTSTSDHFGVSVACNHNGTRIMASGSAVNSKAGRVRVYEYQGGVEADWVQIGQDLTGANETNARFGHSMDMSGDGNIIAIGAPFEHAKGLGDSGTVRVFYLVGNTWTILPDSGSLTGDTTSGLPDVFIGPATNDELGRAVKLSYDGKTLAFNITNEDEGGTDRGQVRVFTYANGAWSNKGSEINGTTNSQQFGLAIDMSDDGDHLIIGGSTMVPNPPEVRVFKWNASASPPAWQLKGSILNHTTGADGFGHAVAISNDGSVIALGIRNADIIDGADEDNRGIVRMYHWSGSSWTLKNTLQYPYKAATNRDDDFGTTVNLSGDGKRLIVSSPWSDDSGDSGGTPGGTAGQLWVFEYYAGNWMLRTPVPSTPAPTFDGYQSNAYTNAGGIGLMGNQDSVLGAGIENDYWLNMNVATLGGQSIAISRDGAAIIAGEWAYNSSSAGGDRGRVRVWSMPSNIKSIWGSNDDVNWTRIVRGPTREEATSNVAGFQFGYNDEIDITNIDNPNYYKYHAIVGDAFTSIRDVKLFGVRNQGSSTLHDGALTLTKNLDVPRIGPPLDADDTPRRDKLVVEYNTSTNPLEDGVVRDTSGRGNDGILMDGAYYDATAKALDIDTFDSSLPSGSQTAHIRSGIIPEFTGNQHHTISLWFKTGSDFSGTWAAVAPNGGEGTANQVSSIAYETSVNRFKIESWNNDIAAPYPISSYTWYHVVVTYEGATVTTSTKKFYVNGTAVTTSDISSGNAVNFTDPVVILGERTVGGNEVNGSISNFKLYDTALTAEEVKTLYDMGRCDDGRHVVNFSKTRVGIGLGDGEIPRAALDVRGGAFFGDHVGIGTSRLVIDNSGRVGIGLTNPPAKMYVKTTAAASMGSAWNAGDFVVSHGVGTTAPSQSLGVAMGVDNQGDSSTNKGYLWCMRPNLSWNTLKIQANILELIGLASVTLNGGANVTSDDRLKTEEEFLQNALPTIMKLKPQTYRKHPFLPNDPSKEATENMTEMPSDLSRIETGLIVQDIWYDAPELRHLVKLGDNANPSEVRPVDPDPNDPTQDPDYSSWGTTPTTLGYQGVFVVAIKAIQELNTELQTERAKVATLETQLASVLTRLDALESA